jgi:2'-5' RNA ligase
MSVNKYFIAIIPPEPIASEIYGIKEYFSKYKSTASLNSPTHITLHMPFEWAKEEKLISTLKKFEVAPFEIELKDFACFEPRVIFIDIVKNKDLESTQSKLMAFCKKELNLFNGDYQDRAFHPHVTLAFRDLRKPMFFEAWNEFKERKYSATFQCSQISLLKHDGKFWREIS